MGKVIHIKDSSGASGTGYIGIFANYTDLITAYPTAPTLSLAYIQNSQGTAWLPGSLGGTFYSKGTYLFDGVNWVDGLDEVADELQDLIDTINTQDLASVLTQGNIANLDVLMRSNNVKFGSTDSDFIKSTPIEMLVSSQNNLELKSNGGNQYFSLLNNQTELHGNSLSTLIFRPNALELVYSDGTWETKINTNTLTSNRAHTLQNKSGVLAHLDDVLKTKSGVVVNATFTGNPKTATVTFGTAFADANYSISLVCNTVSGTAFTPVVESIAAGSFVINMTVNNITNLTDVRWIAVKNGEN